MNKLKVLAFSLGLAVFAMGAQIPLPPPSQGVVYDFDKNANFLNYRTYKWVAIPSTEQLDELTASQLIGTLQVELEKKGLTRSDSDKVDLYIGYQIATARQKPSPSENIGASYGSAGGGSVSAGATVNIVHFGQLTLLMYDAARKQLVWRGVVSNSIDAEAKPDKKQKRMGEAIEKLLKKYPPEKKP
jgi:hypothetical protein